MIHCQADSVFERPSQEAAGRVIDSPVMYNDGFCRHSGVLEAIWAAYPPILIGRVAEGVACEKDKDTVCLCMPSKVPIADDAAGVTG